MVMLRQWLGQEGLRDPTQRTFGGRPRGENVNNLLKLDRARENSEIRDIEEVAGKNTRRNAKIWALAASLILPLPSIRMSTDIKGVDMLVTPAPKDSVNAGKAQVTLIGDGWKKDALTKEAILTTPKMPSKNWMGQTPLQQIAHRTRRKMNITLLQMAKGLHQEPLDNQDLL